MGFPLSVDDIWKVFEWANRRKVANKEAVCKWLDAVYTDLVDLSKVWARICETLETANEEKQIDKAMDILRRGDSVNQRVYAGRLLDFYQSASSVLGSSRRTADFHGNFVNTLGGLLLERRRAREILDKKLPQDKFALKSEATETLMKMRETVEAIQKEAVSLQVLIQTFKAESN